MSQKPASRRARLLLCAALLVALVTGLIVVDAIPPTPVSAAFPGANGKIAFANTLPGEFPDIYVMDADGNNLTNVTNHPAFDTEPTWSPDGTKIAFRSARDGNHEIYVMDPDGSNVTRLTNHPMDDSTPAWSPDGSKIAFNSTRTGYENIWVMNADGSNPVNLTDIEASNLTPAWSPDGSKIAFASSRDGNLEIYVMDSDGGNLTRLTNNTAFDSAPNWSPDGSKIVFQSNRDGNHEIHVMNANGSSQVNLTNNPLFDGSPAWSPDGTKIIFTRFDGVTRQLYVMDADGGNQLQLTNVPLLAEYADWQPLPCALLVVPGIAGTYASNPSNDLDWLMQRGAHPDQMVVDPLGRVYDDLIQTLQNTGYTLDQDLFVVTYDWRLPPAPFDGTIDGVVSGLTGASITDSTFAHSVDYFGHFLKLAVEAHEAQHPGARLGCVDVIAHSTGGLVTRSYIQSTAYQDSFTSANGERDLPRVNQLIMLGVPNRGASKAWNPLNDNWAIDIDYRVVLSKIVYRAWLKVAIYGETIPGPDHTITRASIDDGAGNPDPMTFIQQYVPTIRALLATYDFLDEGSGADNVNGDLQWRNSLLLDLNNGLDLAPTADPSPFASLSSVTAIYGADQTTATIAVARTGPSLDPVIAPFTDFTTRKAEPGEPWYQDIQLPANGDGTVPTLSAAGQFEGDSRVTLIELTGATTSGSTGHTGLVGNPDVQATMLSILGRSWQAGDIASGSAVDYLAALSVIFDPVEGYLQDGLGRRLGYTGTTGPLTEIPGSVWFGTTDGFGIVTEPLVLPLTLHLVGLGDTYVVHVTFEHEGQQGGITAEGFLGEGETLILPVELAQEEPPQGTHFQACLFAGSLSQVSAIGTSTTTTVSCGRGTAIVLLAGEDLLACLFAGSLSQVGTSEPRCSRGEAVGFASGAGYHGCVYAGSLSQVGTSMPASCGRGARVSLSGPVAR